MWDTIILYTPKGSKLKKQNKMLLVKLCHSESYHLEFLFYMYWKSLLRLFECILKRENISKIDWLRYLQNILYSEFIHSLDPLFRALAVHIFPHYMSSSVSPRTLVQPYFSKECFGAVSSIFFQAIATNSLSFDAGTFFFP